jgi:pescadillo protein
MHTRALRKVFLSIKGVYYQAEVMGETITWLVPYQFTQNIPTDVDVRVMLTFLELYQTLLGFVFYKLYTDAGLVYPPPIDAKKDEEAAGVGAFSLLEVEAQLAQDAATSQPQNGTAKVVDAEGKTVKGRDVRRSIKEIASIPLPDQDAAPLPTLPKPVVEDGTPDEEFVQQPSSSTPSDALPTLHSLSALPAAPTKLFAPYVIFLSLGTPRSLLEFIIRSFGGRVGWPATVGSGSPFAEDDERITHIIVDRPLPPASSLAEAEMELRRKRKYVQPQWVVDCVNSGKILLEELYGQGKTLPPHLSPFGEGEGAYVPEAVEPGTVKEDEAEEMASDEEDEEEEEEAEAMDEDESEIEDDEDVPKASVVQLEKAIKAAAEKPSDAALLRAAELEAERAGLNAGEFEEGLRKAVKKAKKAGSHSTQKEDKTKTQTGATEVEMNKMLMSNKKRKLYERMKYGERKRAEERAKLEQKRDMIKKEKHKELRKSLHTDRS